jgi:transporter family protein
MLYILLATLMYTVAIIVSAVASRTSNTSLVSAVINTVSAIIPVVVIVPLLSKQFIVSQKNGILLAIAAGVLIALFSMALNKAYSVVPVGIVVPLIFGGSIILSAILSVILLKEHISLVQAVGIATMTIGLAIIIYARLQTAS